MNKTKVPQELVEECAYLIVEHKRPVDEVKAFRDLDMDSRKACLWEAQQLASVLHLEL